MLKLKVCTEERKVVYLGRLIMVMEEGVRSVRQKGLVLAEDEWTAAWR